MKQSTSIITTTYIVALIAFIGYGYFLQENADENIIQAHIEAPDIRISAKIPGRVDSIQVTEGDQVNPGDIIFSLESPELDAKKTQALALIDAKQALQDRANRGARSEEIQMAKDNAQRAKATAELAENSLRRLQNLFNDGLVSAQKLDEAKTQATSAIFAQQSAQQRYQMAKNGTEQELITAAESDLHAAQGVLAEVDAALAETQIKATKGGEVSSVLIHEGEISPAGFPVVTLVDLDNAYVRFHVQETQLNLFNKDTLFDAYLPALAITERLEVYYVASMGDYATWRASKPGEYDLKTFEIRARPVQKNSQWRAGMSAIITLPR